MLRGFNHNIGYRGLVFHAQTEHVLDGDTAHQIDSVLFFGGSVVSWRKSRHQLSEGPQLRTNLRKLIQHQHRQLLKDLTRGQLDEEIAATPGTGEFEALPKSTPATTSQDDDSRDAAVDTPPSPAEQRFRAGLRALQKRDYEQCLMDWSYAVALEPDVARYRKNLELIQSLIRFFRSGSQR
jgi:hypothetical protein